MRLEHEKPRTGVTAPVRGSKNSRNNLRIPSTPEISQKLCVSQSISSASFDQYPAIPSGIKAVSNWVCWDFHEQTNEDTGEVVRRKIPKNPHKKANAKTNDPTTWGSYEEAIQGVAMHGYRGIGFVFTEDCEFFGVDLDKCIDDTKFVDEFVEGLQSYNEKSISGTGIHIICKGTLPNGARRNGPVEMYSEGRFFIMTGKPYNAQYSEIVDCSESIKPLHEKYLPSKKVAPPSNTPKRMGFTGSADDLIRTIERSAQAEKFRNLFYGGGETDDVSTETTRLLGVLAWYTHDKDLVRSVFEKSALMRDKCLDPRTGYGDWLGLEITRTFDIVPCGYTGNSAVKRSYTEVRGEEAEPEAEGKRKKPPFSIEELTKILASMNVQVLKNDVTKAVDILNPQGEIIESASLEFLATRIVSDHGPHFSHCSFTHVERYLSLLVGNQVYNPVLQLIEGEGWSGSDELAKVYQALHIEDDPLSCVLIKKWLWQNLSLLRNTLKDSYEPLGVLTFQGRQGTGKTTFCRILSAVDEAQPHKYFNSGVELNFSDKDTIIRATCNFITELGELDCSLKQDAGKLKSFLTQTRDTYRRPYGRGDISEMRRTGFCATVNPVGFLVDPTGSRRFLTIPTDAIDWKVANSINTLELYRQIDQWAKTDPKGYALSHKEQQQLEARNANFDKPIKGFEEVADVLAMCQSKTRSYIDTYMTVTEWKKQFTELNRLSVRDVGAVLNKLGHEQKSVREGKGKPVKARLLPRYRF